MTSRQLPHETTDLFLTDGGIETWLMYKKGWELPHFSAFHLMNDPRPVEDIRDYFRSHAAIAKQYGTGFIFDNLTYRSSRDWGRLLGYSRESLAEINHRIFTFYRSIADEVGLDSEKVLYSGCIGPRGDAYNLNHTMTADEAEDYHSEQVETFKAANADFITGLTMNSVNEAIGISKAATTAGLPCVISFMLEREGLLAGNISLRSAIEAVDAATENAPAYYMINCSHPDDFSPALDQGSWMKRLRGLRANASSLDHGQLCQLGRLDEGNPAELAQQHRQIARTYPHINVYGGCCGTDYVHVELICREVMSVAGKAA